MEEVRVLNVKTNDIIVIKLDYVPKSEHYDSLFQRFKELTNVKILILAKGEEISVLRTEGS